MQLLNRADYRLALYMATFSAESDSRNNQLREILEARDIANNNRVTPEANLPVPRISSLEMEERATRQQARQLSDAIKQVQSGVNLSDEERLNAETLLRNLVTSEIQSQDQAGQTPLARVIDKTSLTNLQTNNDINRYRPDGSLIPIQEDIPRDSPLAQRLQAVADSNNPRIQAERLAAERRTIGSAEDLAREQRKQLLESNALDIRAQLDRLNDEPSTPKKQEAYTKAKNRMAETVLDAKRGLLSGDQRLASKSDRRAAYDALIAQNGGQRPSSAQVKEYLAQQGIIDPQPTVVQQAMGGLKKPKTETGGVVLPASKGTLLERKQRSIKNAQQNYNPIARQRREGNTFLMDASKELADLNNPDSWANAALRNLPKTSPLPIPSYAVRDASGNIVPSKIQLNPAKGKGLERRLTNLLDINNIVQQAKEAAYVPNSDEAIRDPALSQIKLPEINLNAIAENQPFGQAIPALPPSTNTPTPLPGTRPSVSLPITNPTVPSRPYNPPINIPIPNAVMQPPPSNAANPAPSFWSQLKQGMNASLPPQTVQQAKQTIGKAKQGISQTVGGVNNAYQSAQQRRQVGIAARQAAQVPNNPAPTGAIPPINPQTQPPTPTATAPGVQSRTNDSFKGSVKTPKGTYEAEATFPDWFKRGMGAKSTGQATNTKVKPQQIVNNIRDGSLLDRVKDSYNNLSPSTRNLALGSALGLGGIGLLAAGNAQSAQDRNAQESRARELAAIASRPPALPENQLEYNPYSPYSQYPY